MCVRFLLSEIGVRKEPHVGWVWGGGGGETSGESREDMLVRSPITNCYPTPAAKSNRLDSLFYSHPLILPLRPHTSVLQLKKSCKLSVTLDMIWFCFVCRNVTIIAVYVELIKIGNEEFELIGCTHSLTTVVPSLL